MATIIAIKQPKHRAHTRLLCKIRGHQWVQDVQYCDYHDRYENLPITCSHCNKEHGK